jgi:hypothetical protein
MNQATKSVEFLAIKIESTGSGLFLFDLFLIFALPVFAYLNFNLQGSTPICCPDIRYAFSLR